MNSWVACQIPNNDSMPLRRDQITSSAAPCKRRERALQLPMKGEKKLCSSGGRTPESQVAQLGSPKHKPKGKSHVASLNPPNYRIKFSKLASLPRAMLGVRMVSEIIGSRSATTNQTRILVTHVQQNPTYQTL